MTVTHYFYYWLLVYSFLSVNVFLYSFALRLPMPLLECFYEYRSKYANGHILFDFKYLLSECIDCRMFHRARAPGWTPPERGDTARRWSLCPALRWQTTSRTGSRRCGWCGRESWRESRCWLPPSPQARTTDLFKIIVIMVVFFYQLQDQTISFYCW